MAAKENYEKIQKCRGRLKLALFRLGKQIVQEIRVDL